MTSRSSQSGFYLLSNNADALVARLALISVARHTLDIQYYIFHNDASGQLIAHDIIHAADRGVRVRILVDDINMSGKDTTLHLFNTHPKIEIRIFNPFVRRKHFRNLELAINLKRAGRRMHNKAFIVDNEAAIIGGRNIGDEYFDDRTNLNFVDLDLLSTGPIVDEVTTSFNDYWNSDWAIPIHEISKVKIAAKQFVKIRNKLKDRWHESVNSEYFQAVRHAGFSQRLISNDLPFIYSDASFFYDKPEKITLDQPHTTTHMGPNIRPYIDNAHSELVLASPYLVPGTEGIKRIRQLGHDGVNVKILTNSLAATDVFAVHAGYARYRTQLLQTGVNLYELKSTARPKRSWVKRFIKPTSQASLHAKYIVIDRELVFVGSANFDPRSRYLNTEIGMVIYSTELAEHVIELFRRSTDLDNSYQVRRVNSRTCWLTHENGSETKYYKDPNVGIWKRLGVFIMSLLPIESLL